MRTTVTLDPDVESLIRQIMKAKGVSFKQALNDAVRAGSHAQPRKYTVSRVMGRPQISLDHALQLAGELEDQELARRAGL